MIEIWLMAIWCATISIIILRNHGETVKQDLFNGLLLRKCPMWHTTRHICAVNVKTDLSELPSSCFTAASTLIVAKASERSFFNIDHYWFAFWHLFLIIMDQNMDVPREKGKLKCLWFPSEHCIQPDVKKPNCLREKRLPSNSCHQSLL